MYTVDINSDEPIMLLNKQIGQSFNEDGTPDGMPYIDGAQFQEELMWLDTLGKKRIQVWINSVGGAVVDAMSIFNAILKSKTAVDTYNVGTCASSAGAIFMAGRKRYMADYAQFMMHPVSGGDEKSMNAFKSSIQTMLSAKSDLTHEMTECMMDATTWMCASDCLMNGICTDIEVTKESNKKYMPSEAKAMMQYSNKLIDEILNVKTQNMDLITNKLNLNKGSNEASILEAINKIETARNQAETQVANLTEQLATAKATADEAAAKVTELQTLVDAANVATAAAEDIAATAIATEAVNKYIARIGNKAEAITKWVNLYKQDAAGTTELLEALPINGKAPVIPINQANTEFKEGSYFHEKMKSIVNSQKQNK